MTTSTGMKQRCWEHDYCAPSFYMITVVTEPRRNCLSSLNPGPGAGNPGPGAGNPGPGAGNPGP
ncbi:MAG: hypothetical protein RRC34_09425, partial [Lentisphaeria bacterium]|nr:hypothetical protein [Lentisphaeria bacterium]